MVNTGIVRAHDRWRRRTAAAAAGLLAVVALAACGNRAGQDEVVARQDPLVSSTTEPPGEVSSTSTSSTMAAPDVSTSTSTTTSTMGPASPEEGARVAAEGSLRHRGYDDAGVACVLAGVESEAGGDAHREMFLLGVVALERITPEAVSAVAASNGVELRSGGFELQKGFESTMATCRQTSLTPPPSATQPEPKGPFGLSADEAAILEGGQ